MLPEFPGMFYVLARPRSRDATNAKRPIAGLYLGGDESLVSRDWMETNIRQGHGPLGALYPPKTWTAPNPHAAIKEGDTPSWFFFLPRGVNDRGTSRVGRLRRPLHAKRARHLSRCATTPWATCHGFASDRVAMAARVSSRFSGAPRLVRRRCLREGEPRAARHVEWRHIAGHCADCRESPAEQCGSQPLAAAIPDQQAINRRAGSSIPKRGHFAATWQLSAPQSRSTSFTAPTVAEPQTIHVVLEVADAGQPQLMVGSAVAVRDYHGTWYHRSCVKLGQQLLDHVPVHVGQAVVAALEAVTSASCGRSPSRCRIVACRSWTWTLSSATREAELVGLAVAEAAA